MELDLNNTELPNQLHPIYPKIPGIVIDFEGCDGVGKHTQANMLYDELKKDTPYINTLIMNSWSAFSQDMHRIGIDPDNIHNIILENDPQLFNDAFITVDDKIPLIQMESYPVYADPSSEGIQAYLRGDFGSDPTKVDPMLAAMMYSYNRVMTYRNSYLEMCYNIGGTLIFDRWTPSNELYQSAKEFNNPNSDNCLTAAMDIAKSLREFEYEKCLLPRPSIIIYLKIPIDVEISLLNKRSKSENRPKDIHENATEYLTQIGEHWNELLCGEKKVICINCLDDSGDNYRIMDPDEIHAIIMHTIQPIIRDISIEALCTFNETLKKIEKILIKYLEDN